MVLKYQPGEEPEYKLAGLREESCPPYDAAELGPVDECEGEVNAGDLIEPEREWLEES